MERLRRVRELVGQLAQELDQQQHLPSILHAQRDEVNGRQEI